MNNLIWLFLFIAVCILVPVSGAVIRRIDYYLQITGRKKMRTLKDGQDIYPEKTEKDPQFESLAHEAGMHSIQNTISRIGS
mgnify:CR=1 FL=1